MDLYTIITNFLLFTPVLAFVHYRGIDFIVDLFCNIKEKYHKFKSLKQLADKNNVNYRQLIKTSIYTIYSVIYYVIIQKLNKSVKKIDKHTYEITYSIGGKIYKFNTGCKKGMGSVLQIIDDNNNDVTEKIEPYFGPMENFHKNDYSPSTFECKTLTFNYSDGSTKTFNEHETIEI
jgi:hypothetical protein